MSNPVRPTCPHCGTLNDDDAIFCGSCGRALAESQALQGSPPQSQEGTKSPKVDLKGTMLGMPSAGAGEGSVKKSEEDQPADAGDGGIGAGGEPRRTNKSTNPGYWDSREGGQPSPPEPPQPGELKGRAALGGPTLLDAPDIPKEKLQPSGSSKEPMPASPQKLQASPPSARSSAANPTLMSESPLRGASLSKKSPSKPADDAVTQRTLLDQPVFGELEKSTEKSAEPEEKTDKPAPTRPQKEGTTKKPVKPIELGGPTLLDQVVFSDAELASPGKGGALSSDPGEAPPPLSKEALALLERFSGTMGTPTGKKAPAPSGGDAKQPSAGPVGTSPEPEKINTLRGVPALKVDDEATPQEQAIDTSSSKPDAKSAAATILGLPVPDAVRAEDVSRAPDTERHEISFEDEDVPEDGSKPADDIGGTMLGIPVQTIQAAADATIETKSPIEQSAPEGMVSPGQGQVPPDEGGMTMLGLPSPARRPSQEAAEEEQPQPSAEPSPIVDDGDSFEIQSRGRGWLVVLLVLGALVVGGVAVAVVKLVFFGDAHDITSEVTVGGDRIKVTLVVDPPVKGGRVRFAGKEQPLEKGRATFEVDSDLLKVGQNKIDVDVESPEGDTSRTTVNFDVSYKAVADLSGLKASPPYYTVEFQVMKTAALKVAGQAVTLDDGGRYLHKIPLNEALAGAMDAGDAISHSVPFSVQLPDQQPVKASIDTAIPRATLRVQSPTDGMVVDRDSIQCTGVTEPNAQIMINGTKVPSPEGRFSHTIPLPTIGEHSIEVVATAQGKAPRTAQFKVRRAENLAPVIQEFAASVDSSLDFDRVNRDPEAVRDSRVRFHGRVVALESSSGQTLMQVLVDEGCAQEGRCSIHVTYRGEAEIRLFAWVTIYGTVSGRWEGQTQGGNRLVMPAILARYVVLDQGRR